MFQLPRRRRGGRHVRLPGTTELAWAEASTWDKAYYDSSTYSGPMSTLQTDVAAVLGYELYDQQTQTGFGCGGCHVGL